MNHRIFLLGTIFSLSIVFITKTIGQSHSEHANGMAHHQADTELPSETGQSAFAAIAEIVAKLEGDSNTDWTTVNIDSLRTHLVDMNELTLNASVTTQELDEQTIQFRVEGTARTLSAINSMVPTHAHMVRNLKDWDIVVISQPQGVTLTVSTSSTDEFVKLKALGFFGFMTIGAHHQLHHFQMATGAGH